MEIKLHNWLGCKGFCTLLIETKAKDMRDAEKRAIEAQSKLLKNIPNTRWELVTNADKVGELLNKL